MSHLTYQQILEFVDEKASKVEREQIMNHVRSCKRCAEIVLQEQNLTHAIKSVPLTGTSRRFTAKVMEKVLPGSIDSFLFRILSGGGRILAMMAILAVVGYALSLNFSDPESKISARPSGLVEKLDQDYRDVWTVLLNQQKQLTRGILETSDTRQWELVGMILLTFMILALLDRFVFRPLTKLKI